VRLLSVIAAPREQIAAILHRHSGVKDLVVNGWIQLVACDDGEFFRFTPQKTWQALDSESARSSVEIDEPMVSDVPVSSLAL
jgi:uncharacterized protein YbcC (UPF0753/DUF2309 family)